MFVCDVMVSKVLMIWKYDECVVVYLLYIDVVWLVVKGWCIVCEDVVEYLYVFEVVDVCECVFGMWCELEDKVYLRDFWCCGCVCVEWK